MRHHSAFVPICILLVLAGNTSPAQLTVSIDDFIETRMYPNINIYVRSTIDGRVNKGLDTTTMLIWEDGFEPSIHNVSRRIGNNPLEIVFIIGNGHGTSANDLAESVAIVKTFLTYFDSSDRASICTFSSSPPRVPPFSSDPKVLRDALETSALTITDSSNFLYDVMVLSAGQVSKKGAIVLISNGLDDSSITTLKAAEKAVVDRGCKFFFFPTGGDAPEVSMVELCRKTGGFVSTSYPDAEDRIVDLLTGSPDYYTLWYHTENRCLDGIDRNLKVQVRVGSDSVSCTSSLHLGRDPLTDRSTVWKMREVAVISGKSTRIDVMQMQEVDRRYLYDGFIQLEFDKTLLKIDSVGKTGALAANHVLSLTDTPEGAKISFNGISQINGTGTVFYFYVTPAEVSELHDVLITANGVALSRGCLNVQISGGVLNILPRKASIEITNAPNLVFTWDGTNQRYSPESAEFLLGVKNNGDLDLNGVSATVALPAGLRLLAFSHPMIEVDSSQLKPGESGSVRWFIKPVPQRTAVSGQFTATIVSDEGAVTQKQFLYSIEAAAKGISFTCNIDPISVLDGIVHPNPVTVTALLKSIGENPAGTVEIILPSELSLVNTPALRSYSALTDRQESMSIWLVKFKETVDTVTYTIHLIRTAPGEVPDTIIVPLTVPGVKEALADMRCFAGIEQLTFDETLNDYIPNPFMVTLDIINIGTVTIDTLDISFNLSMLVETTQNDSFRILNLNPGATATLTLELMYTGRFCEDYTEIIEWIGRYDGGNDLHCLSAVLMPGLRGKLNSLVEQMPPSLLSVAQGARQTFRVKVDDPMDSTLTYQWFVGTQLQAGSNDSLDVVFPDTGPQIVRCLITNICGDTVVAEWTFDVTLDLERMPSSVNGFTLLGNYPNPFNPSTTIEYKIPEGEHFVTLNLLNAAGTPVRTLFADQVQGGQHNYILDATELASGNYFIRLESGSVTVTRPVTLVK